jgi:hypothetical protein
MYRPPHVDVEGQSRAGLKAPQPNHVLSTNSLQVGPPHLLHHFPTAHRTPPRIFLRQLVIHTMHPMNLTLSLFGQLKGSDA